MIKGFHWIFEKGQEVYDEPLKFYLVRVGASALVNFNDSNLCRRRRGGEEETLNVVKFEP